MRQDGAPERQVVKGIRRVSIDPSSIPSFGVPQQPAGQPGPPPLVVPNQDLVKQLLDQMELKSAVDGEGDLFAPWEGFRVYYMFRGDQQELFAVRAFYDHVHTAEEKPALLAALDEWNRETLWPKVYTHAHEDGFRVVSEQQMLVGMGVNIDYYVTMTANWTNAAVTFHQWLGERMGWLEAAKPDETVADGDAGSADATGSKADATESKADEAAEAAES